MFLYYMILLGSISFILIIFALICRFNSNFWISFSEFIQKDFHLFYKKFNLVVNTLGLTWGNGKHKQKNLHNTSHNNSIVLQNSKEIALWQKYKKILIWHNFASWVELYKSHIQNHVQRPFKLSKVISVYK